MGQSYLNQAESRVPKNGRFYSGTTAKLNKTDTNYAWKEFGGDNCAVTETDGSAYITLTTERASKHSGSCFKLTEKLTRQTDGYGYIEWRIDLNAVPRRNQAKRKFDENWKDAILAKVKEIVVDCTPVFSASKALANELGVPFSTARPNLWAADKWSKGASTTFIPHRSMIRPIFDLLCELGKKDEVLFSLEAYCSSVTKPSSHVQAILDEYKNQ